MANKFLSVTTRHFVTVKQSLEICLTGQSGKVIIWILFKSLHTKWAPTKTKLLTLIKTKLLTLMVQENRIGRWLFGQTHGTNMHIRNLFDKWLWVFQKNILTALATKKILHIPKDQLLIFLVSNA